MTVRPRLRHTRRALLALAATVTLALGGLLAGGAATPSQGGDAGAVRHLRRGGTPCVAAHSTTRALYAAYDGPLYQVKRASDGATTNISPLSAGGVANSAAQDSFCASTNCSITEIYDQSGNGNNLTDAPAGGRAPAARTSSRTRPRRRSRPAATRSYGVFISPGMGYRDDSTKNIATGNASEGEYAVLDGTHYNNGCCFDYGNAETNNDDDGAGTMEAIYFGNENGLGLRLRQRPVDHGRHGERPVLRLERRPQLRPTRPSLPVHHRDDRGRRQPVGDPRRQRAVRLAVDLLQRGAALGLQPDEEAGRDHPRHRRRQQRQLGRHLLRGRDDLRLPVGRTEASVQANIVAAGYTTRCRATRYRRDRQISLQATTPCCVDYSTGRHQRRRGADV